MLRSCICIHHVNVIALFAFKPIPIQDGERVDLDIVWEKMSKSKFNGVEPDQVVEKFGADTTRVFTLFKVRVYADEHFLHLFICTDVYIDLSSPYTHT